ncbi:hypothetical protein [Nostoc sp.]|uniref:hypothetical protein n=1 Tax=Nostoc sp. TaxID=1180 RepID=UPI002FFC18E2
METFRRSRTRKAYGIATLRAKPLVELRLRYGDIVSRHLTLVRSSRHHLHAWLLYLGKLQLRQWLPFFTLATA